MLATHKSIDSRLCGNVSGLAPGSSTVELLLTDVMRADGTGLVHGGFIFGAADYAAMVAVNSPNVVLGAASVKFLKPALVGETLIFTATVLEDAGKRRRVDVVGRNAAGVEVFSGVFDCIVPERHVLQSR